MMMPPQHDIEQERTAGGSNNSETIWSKIEAEKKRQSNIRTKLSSQQDSGGGVRQKKTTKQSVDPPPSGTAWGSLKSHSAHQGSSSSQHPPLAPPSRATSAPAQTTSTVPSTPRQSRKHNNKTIATPTSARSNSKPPKGDRTKRSKSTIPSGSTRSTSTGANKHNNRSLSPPRSKSEHVPSSTMWTPTSLPPGPIFNPDSQYSQDSSIQSVAWSGGAGSSADGNSGGVENQHRNSSKRGGGGSGSIHVRRNDPLPMAPDLGNNSADETASFHSSEKPQHSGPKRPEQRMMKKSSSHHGDPKRTQSLSSQVSSNVTSETRPSSFASTINQSPGAPQSRGNSIAGSSGRMSKSSLASGTSQQSMGYTKTPQGTRRKKKVRNAPGKTNSMGSSKDGGGTITGESSDGSFPLPPAPPQHQTSVSTMGTGPGEPPLASDDEWFIDNDGGDPHRPSSRPNLMNDDSSIDIMQEDSNRSSTIRDDSSRKVRSKASKITLAEYMGGESGHESISNMSQRSGRTGISQRSGRSAPPKWNSTRVIKQEDIKETEGWVYLIACILFTLTTGGLASIILFVFGAARNQDLAGTLQVDVEYLSDNVAVFDDANSPQSQAVYWLAEQDEADIDVFNDQLRREQRYALSVLYFATAGSERWRNKYNFLSSKHECDWNDQLERIQEQQQTTAAENVVQEQQESIPLMGVTCNANKRVTHVRLAENGLQGTIPVELNALSDLVELTASSNSLSGTIPSLTIDTLEWLELGVNSIEGSIPELVGDLTNLRYLDLSRNQLASGIPTSIQQLVKLESLLMGHNNLNGTFSEGASMPALVELNLTSNALTGSVDFLPGFGGLEILDISANKFFGTIPFLVGGLTQLRSFHFAENSIQGSLPGSIGLLTNLAVLSANRNALSGTFPWTGISAETSPFREISLADNSLTGTLPDDLLLLGFLEVVDFGRNQLSGSIPNGIGSMNQLRHLDLALNKLTGLLPNGLGFLESVTTINLSGNSLSGGIPPSMGSLRTLKDLELNNNLLTGTVPIELGFINEIETINLHENTLSGDLEFFCLMDPIPLISADCAGGSPEITCSCCAVCL